MVPFPSPNPNAERWQPNTIILSAMDEVEFDDLPGPTDTEVRLGMLLERVSGRYQIQSTDGARATPLFAVPREDASMLPDDTVVPTEQDYGIRHDRYYPGDTVIAGKLDKGHKVLGLLADGQTVTDGDPLFPDGTGAFRAGDFDGTAPDDDRSDSFMMAIEDYDNSGESDGPDYVRMEVTR